jgi:hypothetical protein
MPELADRAAAFVRSQQREAAAVTSFRGRFVNHSRAATVPLAGAYDPRRRERTRLGLTGGCQSVAQHRERRSRGVSGKRPAPQPSELSNSGNRRR